MLIWSTIDAIRITVISCASMVAAKVLRTSFSMCNIFTVCDNFCSFTSVVPLWYIDLTKTKEFYMQVKMNINDYKTLLLPGVKGAKVGMGFVKVTDIPGAFDDFMQVNPRVPNRSKKGILSGPVIHGIKETLLDKPHEMAIKNQGIYLLVEHVKHDVKGNISVTMTDPGRHGVVNGGHTYAAIREVVEAVDAPDSLKDAYVRLHIFEGIEPDMVPEMAEGLNRSKQVDDPSLVNLQGEFDIIRKVMNKRQGADDIAYHQGDDGNTYISEILVYLEMFNRGRYDDKRHPNALYNKQSLGLRFFAEDMSQRKKVMTGLIDRLPELLWLADTIRKMTPDAARANGFRFGRARIGADGAKVSTMKSVKLPFIGEDSQYRVPNGWIYPVLASFRANLTDKGWKVPVGQVLQELLPDLVAVCVVEHRDNNLRPEVIGKRESAYAQTYNIMQLYLARKGLL